MLEERWSSEIVRLLLAAEGDVGIIVEGIRTEGLDKSAKGGRTRSNKSTTKFIVTSRHKAKKKG